LEQILADSNLSQHWTRSVRDGLETIVAYYRCQFSVGQQRYVLLIPFQPALKEIPKTTANVIDDFDARVRITDLQKFGARLEIVLAQPATVSVHLLVEVIASAGMA